MSASIDCIAAQRSSSIRACPAMASSRSRMSASIDCIAAQRSSSIPFQFSRVNSYKRVNGTKLFSAVIRRALMQRTAESRNSTATIVGNSCGLFISPTNSLTSDESKA